MSVSITGQDHESDSQGASAVGDERTDERLPLTLGQEQLWFLSELSPGNSAYNVLHAYRLFGPLDVDILRQALIHEMNRHEALRATFNADAGIPYQVVRESAVDALTVEDLTGLAAPAREEAVQHALREEADQPFDLRSGPLYRFRLLRTGPQEHVLWFCFHHIVTDGWSSGILYDELPEVYRALRDGDEPQLGPLPGRYVDFARWQREEQQGLMEEQLRYWEERLGGIQVLDLPADRARPANPDHRGAEASVEVPPALLSAVRATAHQHGVSVLMLLATGLTAVLARYTGREDIPLGISMLGRTEPEHEQIVGLFTNMIVLRSDLSGDPTMAELLVSTGDALLDAYDYQGAPFGAVVERVQPVRDASRNPLFQVCLQLVGAGNSGGNLTLPDIVAESLHAPVVRSRFDLTLNCVESADSLRIDVEYAAELFDPDRIDRFLRHTVRALDTICSAPDTRLSELPLLSTEERDELLAAGRGELSGLPPGVVHVAVAERAAADPDAVALICRGKPLSYGELDRRAETLGRYLQLQGVGHEQIVGIALHRDLDAIVALLGVLKSGGAYTVLDPAHPAARMDFMLRDTGAPLLLTTSDLVERLPQPDGWRVVELDRQWAEIEAAAGPAPAAPVATPDSLAYVLYTSGSSGKPKGVLLEHRALLSFAHQYGHAFDLHPGDRMLHLSALSFDMSHGELFAGLVAGATLVLVPQEGTSPDALAELMRAERVSFISMSPAMLALVDADPYPDLKKMQAGGDLLPGEVANKWTQPGRRVLNVYGPTEAAVACTAYECDPAVTWRSSPPIGGPFLDRRLYVVDRWGNLVPKGVPGELLIGGDEGIARGYLNRADLTEQRFADDPFHPTGRIYRSGDLVKWTDDWQIQFLGRLDAQIQLNGLRIELEEIESTLLAHPQVGLAAVAVRPTPQREMQLVGYVTPAPGQAPDIAELRAHLGRQLPDYMVPTAWVVLDELPLTTARKVDRQALPDPVATLTEEKTFVAYGTDTERKVAEVLAEILDRPRVSADDSFFELGGNSMQAMRAVSRLNKAFGIRLNVRSLYGGTTVVDVAKRIDALLGEARGPDKAR
jgi:amino acid adenylation domain-containing protein